jgi:hypothetical protein
MGKHNLDNLVDEDQTGFVPGRYIGAYTRLMFDIMFETEKN